MGEPKFLVVRLGSLGDIVHAFPAVSGLRRSFAQSEIVWLTHPKWEQLVRSAALANDVWTVDTRKWSQLRSILARIRRHPFEAAIDYQGLWKSAAMPFLAGVPRRIGFSSETIREAGVPILYNERVRVNASAHVADQNGELTARAGASVPIGEVSLDVPQEAMSSLQNELAQAGIGEYIVLSPGGGWRSKCWPAQRFGLLAQKILQEFGIRCVINTGPEEEDLIAEVLSAAGESQPVPQTGNLARLMALLKNAKAVIAGDTGPLHLADALGTSTAALFGPTDPVRNGPYRRTGVVLRWEGATTTYKRGTEPDDSLLHISVDEVMSALRGLRSDA